MTVGKVKFELEKAKERAAETANLLKTMPSAELEANNKKEIEKARADFETFKRLYEEGRCFTCEKPFKTFSSQSPCIHWLLNPKGFKKQKFLEIARNYSFIQIESFLRWLANIEKPLQNINDLKFDQAPNKIIETTIRYRHLEWSFSCTEQDLTGHDTLSANFPHYHFQMRIQKKSFINYNDFHVPFSPYDLWFLTMIREYADTVHHNHLYGEGISAVLNDEFAGEIINGAIPTDDTKNAQFEMSTIIRADEGHTISGDLIADLLKESRDKKVTIAKLARERITNAHVRTIVSEGEGVVEKAPRKKTRK